MPSETDSRHEPGARAAARERDLVDLTAASRARADAAGALQRDLLAVIASLGSEDPLQRLAWNQERLAWENDGLRSSLARANERIAYLEAARSASAGPEFPV